MSRRKSNRQMEGAGLRAFAQLNAFENNSAVDMLILFLLGLFLALDLSQIRASFQTSGLGMDES